jgi:hypothetical protein
MVQEEKELLIRDLCSRLPYGVILNCCNMVGEKLTAIDENGLINHDYDIDEVKPCLFPMSSMSEEQKREYIELLQIGPATGIDWLNANHFDYRGLIEKGLAIEAPEGMYN